MTRRFLVVLIMFLGFVVKSYGIESGILLRGNDTIACVSGRKYHISLSCPIATNLSTTAMPLSQAKKGRKGCLICSSDLRDVFINLKADDEADLIQRGVWVYNGQYHISENCPRLKCPSYECEDMALSDAEGYYDMCSFCLKQYREEVHNYSLQASPISYYLLWSGLLAGVIIIVGVLILRYKHIKDKWLSHKIQFKSKIHHPLDTSVFLQKFTSEGVLKYTTHSWDESLRNGDYKEFREEYRRVIMGDSEHLRSECPHLWDLLSNFLLQDYDSKSWGAKKLKIGYNEYLWKWLEAHPDKQPFEMPLSEFPSDIRPKIVDGEQLSEFHHVVEYFKKCIEFRGDDLFRKVKRIFKGVNLDRDKLDTLKSVTFFTDTEEVESALERVFYNISARKEYPDVEISCDRNTEGQVSMIKLEILQIGSFSNADIESPKVLGLHESGDLQLIKTYLQGLCDFSVESQFMVKGKETPCRINYLSLTPDKSGIEILNDPCRGYKYIFSFYQLSPKL